MKPMHQLFFMFFISTFLLMVCSCTEPDSSYNFRQLNCKSGSKIVKFSVEGIHCTSCKINIEAKLRSTAGIDDAEVYVDHEQNNVHVAYNPVIHTIENIKKIISDMGKTVVGHEETQ